MTIPTRPPLTPVLLLLLAVLWPPGAMARQVVAAPIAIDSVLEALGDTPLEPSRLARAALVMEVTGWPRLAAVLRSAATDLRSTLDGAVETRDANPDWPANAEPDTMRAGSSMAARAAAAELASPPCTATVADGLVTSARTAVGNGRMDEADRAIRRAQALDVPCLRDMLDQWSEVVVYAAPVVRTLFAVDEATALLATPPHLMDEHARSRLTQLLPLAGRHPTMLFQLARAYDHAATLEARSVRRVAPRNAAIAFAIEASGRVDNPSLTELLGMLFVEAGRLEEGVLLLETLASEYPLQIRASRLLITGWLSLGEPDRATGAWTRAMAAHPDDTLLQSWEGYFRPTLARRIWAAGGIEVLSHHSDPGSVAGSTASSETPSFAQLRSATTIAVVGRLSPGRRLGIRVRREAVEDQSPFPGRPSAGDASHTRAEAMFSSGVRGLRLDVETGISVDGDRSARWVGSMRAGSRGGRSEPPCPPVRCLLEDGGRATGFPAERSGVRGEPRPFRTGWALEARVDDAASPGEILAADVVPGRRWNVAAQGGRSHGSFEALGVMTFGGLMPSRPTSKSMDRPVSDNHFVQWGVSFTRRIGSATALQADYRQVEFRRPSTGYWSPGLWRRAALGPAVMGGRFAAARLAWDFRAGVSVSTGSRRPAPYAEGALQLIPTSGSRLWLFGRFDRTARALSIERTSHSATVNRWAGGLVLVAGERSPVR